MKLEKLKKLIVKDLKHMYVDKQERFCFKNDIMSSKDVWDIIYTLEEYGWSKQGALDIIFKHSIKDYQD